MRERARIAARLIARGWAAETPAAIVVGAATPQAWRWTGTLAQLGAVVIPDLVSRAPGLLVVGDVVSLAATIGGAEDSVEKLDSAALPLRDSSGSS